MFKLPQVNYKPLQLLQESLQSNEQDRLASSLRLEGMRQENDRRLAGQEIGMRASKVLREFDASNQRFSKFGALLLPEEQADMMKNVISTDSKLSDLQIQASQFNPQIAQVIGQAKEKLKDFQPPKPTKEAISVALASPDPEIQRRAQAATQSIIAMEKARGHVAVPPELNSIFMGMGYKEGASDPGLTAEDAQKGWETYARQLERRKAAGTGSLESTAKKKEAEVRKKLGGHLQTLRQRYGKNFDFQGLLTGSVPIPMMKVPRSKGSARMIEAEDPDAKKAIEAWGELKQAAKDAGKSDEEVDKEYFKPNPQGAGEVDATEFFNNLKQAK